MIYLFCLVLVWEQTVCFLLQEGKFGQDLPLKSIANVYKRPLQKRNMNPEIFI